MHHKNEYYDHDYIKDLMFADIQIYLHQFDSGHISESTLIERLDDHVGGMLRCIGSYGESEDDNPFDTRTYEWHSWKLGFDIQKVLNAEESV